ncbi:putative MIP18 family protein [Trypanosoma conorhini]|uniref:Putative MIP18 family protein n=1 Tax=Trypanosoma conorhini TaxID=83891 RepID=A0A3R7NY98_9TRYP|nr:putative MIP18 family protein [Trypanosoma conorhini]RNF09633.1 putative MIP18 family protein [Trypanosoma conorhini]
MSEEYTAEDVFYEISTIRDPEKRGCTLAELGVVAPERCSVAYGKYYGNSFVDGSEAMRGARASNQIAVVRVVLKPTVIHCSLMAIICLCVYARLKETLPAWMCDSKIDISLVDGSHLQQRELEKQISDKERVAAALENEALRTEMDRLMNADSE